MDGAKSFQELAMGNLHLTVACLRGLGAHRRAQIGPQRSDESRGARTKTRTGPLGGVLRGQAC
jgi:hypothetical protein